MPGHRQVIRTPLDPFVGMLPPLGRLFGLLPLGRLVGLLPLRLRTRLADLHNRTTRLTRL